MGPSVIRRWLAGKILELHGGCSITMTIISYIVDYPTIQTISPLYRIISIKDTDECEYSNGKPAHEFYHFYGWYKHINIQPSIHMGGSWHCTNMIWDPALPRHGGPPGNLTGEPRWGAEVGARSTALSGLPQRRRRPWPWPDCLVLQCSHGRFGMKIDGWCTLWLWLTVCHGKWSIEIDGFKIGDFPWHK